MGFDPISAVADLLTQGLKSFFPDKTIETQQVYGLAQSLVNQIGTMNAAQSTTDTAEASTGNMFIAGARPFILWCCAFGLFYTTILLPFTGFFLALFGMHLPADLPTLSDNLWQLTLGLLGLGGMRTIEKLQGADTKAITSLVSGVANL